MKISRRDVLIMIVVTALLLFGHLSFKADSLKLSTFEAQHIELQLKGLLPRAQQ